MIKKTKKIRINDKLFLVKKIKILSNLNLYLF
jgi:hypothetical protein